MRKATGVDEERWYKLIKADRNALVLYPVSDTFIARIRYPGGEYAAGQGFYSFFGIGRCSKYDFRMLASEYHYLRHVPKEELLNNSAMALLADPSYDLKADFPLTC